MVRLILIAISKTGRGILSCFSGDIKTIVLIFTERSLIFQHYRFDGKM